MFSDKSPRKGNSKSSHFQLRAILATHAHFNSFQSVPRNAKLNAWESKWYKINTQQKRTRWKLLEIHSTRQLVVVWKLFLMHITMFCIISHRSESEPVEPAAKAQNRLFMYAETEKLEEWELPIPFHFWLELQIFALTLAHTTKATRGITQQLPQQRTGNLLWLFYKLKAKATNEGFKVAIFQLCTLNSSLSSQQQTLHDMAVMCLI